MRTDIHLGVGLTVIAQCYIFCKHQSLLKFTGMKFHFFSWFLLFFPQSHKRSCFALETSFHVCVTLSCKGSWWGNLAFSFLSQTAMLCSVKDSFASWCFKLTTHMTEVQTAESNQKSKSLLAEASLGDARYVPGKFHSRSLPRIVLISLAFQ